MSRPGKIGLRALCYASVLKAQDDLRAEATRAATEHETHVAMEREAATRQLHLIARLLGEPEELVLGVSPPGTREFFSRRRLAASLVPGGIL